MSNRFDSTKRNAESGFTLVELVIVVAIIGILATVAIPSFINYQLSSKRTEVYTNLASLAKTQKSFFAEYNTYIVSAPQPGATTGELPKEVKRGVAPIELAFRDVGWTPDGDVYFDYDTVADGFGACSCSTCFTAAAYGDLDGNDSPSKFAYYHPDLTGTSCGLGAGGNTIPTINGEKPYDTVFWYPGTSRF
jgi:prepilin-type N-terminal cleavage/methylation domain-containing protein